MATYRRCRWAPRQGVMVSKLVSREPLRQISEFVPNLMLYNFGLVPYISYVYRIPPEEVEIIGTVRNVNEICLEY